MQDTAQTWGKLGAGGTSGSKLARTMFSKVKGQAALAGLSWMLLCPASFAVISSDAPPAEYLKADAPPISWMVRMGGEISLELPNPKLVLETGKQLPLFQQTSDSYVAMTTDSDGELHLTAFPRYVGNEPAAWVSLENLLVFGNRSPSIRGQFKFERDEMVQLLRETPEAYVVDVLRLGRHMPLTIPKNTAGVLLVPVQKAEHQASAAARTGVITTRNAPQNLPNAPISGPERITADTALIHASNPASGDVASELAIAKIKEEFIKDLMSELEKVKQQRAIEDAKRAAEEAAKPPVITQPATAPQVIVQKIEVPVEKAPQTQAETQWTFLSEYARENAITLLIIAMAAIVLPFIVIGSVRALNRKSGTRNAAAQAEQTPDATKTPLATEVFTFSSVGESHSTDTNIHHNSPPAVQPAGATNHGDLSGTLSGYILPQVVQFFCAARESGRMTIRQENGLVEELLFNNGSIIDARTGSITGKDAARAILQQRDGKFNFHRANTSNDKRLIQDETMALLLEAHQALDENRRTRHGT